MGYYQAGDYYAAGDPGFFSWLGRAAKSVGGAIFSGVKAIAPIAAPIVGTVFGGPLGGMIGGGVGALLSGGGGGGEAPNYGVPQPHAAAYNDMVSFAQPPQMTTTGYGRPAYDMGFAPPPPRYFGGQEAGPSYYEDEEEEEY